MRLVLLSASSFVDMSNPFRTIKKEKKKELEKERKYKTGCEVGSVYISAKATHDYANML